jgi:PhzF family phenazine biosynthesis protein
MQEIAKRNNFSETAFIDIISSDKYKFKVRYFTPSEEVDICGHAALASFQVLKALGYLKAANVYHCTKAGELKVLVEKSNILIEMKKPEIVMQLSRETLLKILNISEDDIITNGKGKIDASSARQRESKGDRDRAAANQEDSPKDLKRLGLQ